MPSKPDLSLPGKMPLDPNHEATGYRSLQTNEISMSNPDLPEEP
jgi:hypothetical protein